MRNSARRVSETAFAYPARDLPVTAARCAVLLYLALFLSAAYVRGRAATGGARHCRSLESGAQPSPNAWQFEDEEEQVPSWRDAFAAQAWDLIGFGAAIAFALVGFFRKSERWKVATLAVTVAYLGFAKSQLISIVNVFALLDWNLPILRYSSGLVSARRLHRSSRRSSGDGCIADAFVRSAR